MKKKIRFTLISNLITILTSLFIFKPYFEEVDDTILAMVSEGTFGKRDAHLIYCNYILGAIQSFLQKLFPGIRWHSVLQYLFIFLTMLLVTYLLQNFRFGKIMSIAFQLGTMYEIYVALQFTKTATLISSCALFALMIIARDYCINGDIQTGLSQTSNTQIKKRLVSNSKERSVLITIALVLFMYASMLRFEPVVVAFSVMLPVAFFDLVRLYKQKKSIKGVAGYAVIAALFGITLLLNILNTGIYNSDDGWRKYNDYHNARCYLVDYYTDALDYSAHSEELTNVGVSENDALMYLVYMLPDDTEYTADEMRNMVSFHKKSISVEMVKNWAQNIYETLMILNPLVLISAMLTILVFILYRKKYLPDIILQLMDVAVILFYFQYSGRWNNRLVFSVLFAEMMAMIYLIVSENQSDDMTGELDTDIELNTDNESHTDSESNIDNVYEMNSSLKTDGGLRTALLLTAGVLLICNAKCLLENRFEHNAYKRARANKDYSVLEAHIEENRDTLFCLDTFTVQDVYKYDVFKPTQEGQLINAVYCGSGLSYSPIAEQSAEAFGYKNPVQALKACDDKVVLVDNVYPNQKMQYITEHGDGHNYSLEETDEIAGYALYVVR